MNEHAGITSKSAGELLPVLVERSEDGGMTGTDLDQLWRVHDMLAATLGERRNRAAVHLAIAVALFSAAAGLLLAGPLPTMLHGLRFGWIVAPAALVLAALPLPVALLGLDPGLPWEKKGIEWWGGYLPRIFGKPLPDGVLDVLREAYDKGVGNRSLGAIARMEGTDRERVGKEVIGQVTSWNANDLALRILGQAVLISSYRSWRRVFVPLAAISIALVSLGALVAVGLAVAHG